MEPHILLQMSLFQDITEETLLQFILSHQHSLKRYKSGEFIALQGDVYRSLYILCNGSVRTQMVSAEGKLLTIESLQAPQLLAPAFIFSSENRFPVNIETLEVCEVLTLNKDAFLEFMHRHPAVMHNFLRLISDRSLFLSRKVNEFALQSLKSRLLNYIKIHGTIGSQQEVAHILGVARPSLARALSELISEGCLLMEGKEMRIDDINARKYCTEIK
ncbi:Crp/Fnr family transcriptional regulator [Bacteroides sp. UBA939]|uniref:Crp/Fnr family transcriptional regulator n=1 Tax=Bacteroides sp. UBA939 TaxID=1946092 RepID=UPI0025C6BD69|nr:Crp/Fnr family transcriptional regulator [Bacteroides sp. UBA939]